jgi:hypothetical protein
MKTKQFIKEKLRIIFFVAISTSLCMNAGCAGSGADQGAENSGNLGVQDPGGNSIPNTGTPDIGNPNIAVSNVRNKGLLESGFLIGTITGGGINKLEARFDSADYQTVEHTSDWKLKLPATGANAWRDGTYHNVVLRARNASGKILVTTTILIQRGTNKDADGDGYPDIVVTEMDQASIFYGAKTGLGAGGKNPTRLHTSSQPGAAILADINGDNYADAIIGINTSGAVKIFYGSENTGVSSEPDETITAIDQNGQFGSSLAAGDLNGDGFTDLAVGAWAENSSKGAAYVFYTKAGRDVFPTDTSGAGSKVYWSENMVNAPAFGKAVAVGDISQDGIADLAVGAPGAKNGSTSEITGAVYVFEGGPDPFGILIFQMSQLANMTVYGRDSSSSFGCAIAMGYDLNGDGIGDLVIGGNTFDGSRGRIYAAYTNLGFVPIPVAIYTGDAQNAYLGSAVAAGDINGDGYADIIAGAYGMARTHIFYSNASGTSSVSSARIDGTGKLGAAVALSDVNGDGFADPIVGANENGAVYVINGKSTPLTDMQAVDAAAILNGGVNFGREINGSGWLYP